MWTPNFDNFGAIRMPNSVGSFDSLSISAGQHVYSVFFVGVEWRMV